MNEDAIDQDGKLNDEDVAIRVYSDEGSIVMAFENPVQLISLTPKMAIDLANELVNEAIKSGVKSPIEIKL